MVFMGLALLITGSVRLCLCDIIPYGIIVLAVCAAAFAVNIPCGSNLMFISRNFPGTPIELIYNACPGILFPIVMCLGQATLPFLAVYLLLPSKCRLKRSKSQKGVKRPILRSLPPFSRKQAAEKAKISHGAVGYFLYPILFRNKAA